MADESLPVVKLGDVLPASYKNGIYKSADFYGEGVPVLRINDFDNQGLLVNENLQKVRLTDSEVESYSLKFDDIIVNRVNSLTHIGKSILWKGPENGSVVYESNMMRIEADRSSVLPEYLIRILHSYTARTHFRKVAKRAVAQCSVSQQDVKSLTFPLPPLAEQQKIAKILSTWDEAIATTEQLLANSEQQKKALMQQLLTGKKRLPGFEGEWQSHVLGDLGSTYPGLAGKNKEDFGDGKPYISYMKVFSGLSINADIFDRVRIERGERQHRVKYGDVLFTTSSEVPEEVGMTSVFLGDMDELYLNSFCFGFRLHDFEVLLPEFAKFKLREWTVRKIIARMAQGATRYNLSKKQLLTLRLQLPGLAEQRVIARVLDLQEEELDLIRRDVERLKAEKKALMQQLLTGKRRVKVDEAERATA